MKGGSKRWKMAHKARAQCHILFLKHCENVTQGATGATADFCHHVHAFFYIMFGNMVKNVKFDCWLCRWRNIAKHDGKFDCLPCHEAKYR
jgi:hypothetical protein